MRLLSAQDFTIEELTDIYNETRIDYIVPMPMNVSRMQKYIHVYDVDLPASCVALDDDGSVLGLCMLAVRPGRGWITRLGVSPYSRRQGAGYAMMNHVIEQAEQLQLDVMYLEVIAGNDPALNLFERLGFHVIRDLQVLRRAPGPPNWVNGGSELTVTSGPFDPEIADARTWRPAWTNQTESLLNVEDVHMVHMIDHTSETSGWVTYKVNPLQLQRVIIGPDYHSDIAPAHKLLYYLHNQYPALDTVVENLPGDSPHLQAFYDHGYVDAFSRIEMGLQLPR